MEFYSSMAATSWTLAILCCVWEGNPTIPQPCNTAFTYSAIGIGAPAEAWRDPALPTRFVGKHQKSLATVVVAQCLPWRRWPRFQAVLVTVSHCKMQFCRFSVFPLQQACQRISVYLHSSFCDFFWIYTLRLNLPIQISSILDGSLFMFSGLRVCSWSVLRTLFHHCLMFHNWGRF